MPSRDKNIKRLNDNHTTQIKLPSNKTFSGVGSIEKLFDIFRRALLRV
jgi:hypothetical protein